MSVHFIGCNAPQYIIVMRRVLETVAAVDEYQKRKEAPTDKQWSLISFLMI